MRSVSSRCLSLRKFLEVPRARNRPSGFSLVKLLLTMGATLLILCIAVPVYFGGRIAAIEAAVTEELRAIHQQQRQYLSQAGHYCATLASLGPAPARLADGTPHGYIFSMTSTASGYTASAAPQPYYGFARRTIHIDETGEVRYSWSTVQSEENKP